MKKMEQWKPSDELMIQSFLVSIYAEFDADSKNVYLFLLILTGFRFKSEKLPILDPVQENMQKRQFFAYKSKTSQNKKKKSTHFRNQRQILRRLICNMTYFEEHQTFYFLPEKRKQMSE